MGAGGSTALVTSLSMIADLIEANTVREIVFSYKKFLKCDADSVPASKHQSKHCMGIRRRGKET